MAVTAVIGTGMTYTYSGFVYNVLDFNIGGITRDVIDATKMTTTTWKEKLFSTLKEPGTATFTIEWDGTMPTMSATASTLSVTFSNSAGLSSSAVLVRFEAAVPLEDKMTAEAEFQITGAWS